MSTDFDIEFEGKVYRMSYKISAGMITVSSGYGKKSATHRTHLPQGMEELLAIEILNDAKRNRVLG